MNEQRIHHTSTSDGFTLGTTMDGKGQPRVFPHPIESGGGIVWRKVPPHLSERFICQPLGNRGHDLSWDHRDPSIPWMARDVVEHVAGPAEPVGPKGEPYGGNSTLVAAVQANVMDAIVPFEPAIMRRVGEQEKGVLGEAIARMPSQSRRRWLKPSPGSS